ncbi:MAG: M24 family metallopeptidase [Acidiferrobacterales bacterium]
MKLPQTLQIRNGEKKTPTFSVEEMSARLAKLRRHMNENDIGAVLFTSFHNINYFDDFLYCAFGRPYGLVVTQDNSTSITANIDGGEPWRRGFGGNLVYTDWQQDNYFRAVKQLIANRVKVGIEFDHMSMENASKLRAALPEVELVDIGKPTMSMRMIKSPEEIDVIREGARIADVGGAACVEALAEGVPEYEIARHATHTMIREIAKGYPNSVLMDTWTWFQSGINTDGAHNALTTRKLQRGDILSLNCFPMIAGYYTALERTLFLDSATDREIELWEINCQVHRRGLELIRPGVRCCDIAAELNEIYLERDLLQYRTFGYGHSFGTLCHYYGREAGLELREDVKTVLAPNMVVSMEPMIMLPQGLNGAGGYREHDILVLNADGAEDITKFPFGPEHNTIKK